jgi:5-methylcytosine-specific restriction protein A
MPKQKMLKPRLKTLDPFSNVKMLQYPKTPTKRVSKADNGRTLALTSAAWRKLRRSVLASEPLCRMCTAQGLTVPATDVDHRDNNPANNELVNLQPLCRSHHSLKTNLDRGHNVRMGCAVDGRPLDHHHHWNEAASTVLARPIGDVEAASERSPATDGHKPISLPRVNA